MGSPLRDLIPSFTAQRGGIRFFRPLPDFTDEALTAEQMGRMREKFNRRRDREATWRRRVDQFCVCQWATRTNGDPYEDERYRFDDTCCPVHGRAEDDDG